MDEQRLLERIGRLLIAQAQVAREVIQLRSVGAVQLGHHLRIGGDGPRPANAGHDGLHSRHTLSTREPSKRPSRSDSRNLEPGDTCGRAETKTC